MEGIPQCAMRTIEIVVLHICFHRRAMIVFKWTDPFYNSLNPSIHFLLMSES